MNSLVGKQNPVKTKDEELIDNQVSSYEYWFFYLYLLVKN